VKKKREGSAAGIYDNISGRNARGRSNRAMRTSNGEGRGEDQNDGLRALEKRHRKGKKKTESGTEHKN